MQKLEELRPHINVVWTTGSQCPELLIKGEIDFCSAWNGRIFDAQKQGAPVNICWECGLTLHIDYYQIPKGAPNKDVAQLFLAWTALPSVNVQLSKYISYGPIKKRRLPHYRKLSTAAPANNCPRRQITCRMRCW